MSQGTGHDRSVFSSELGSGEHWGMCSHHGISWKRVKKTQKLVQDEAQLSSLSFDTSQNLQPGGWENLSSKFGSSAEGLECSPWDEPSIISFCCCPWEEVLDIGSVIYNFWGDVAHGLPFVPPIHSWKSFSGVLLGSVINLNKEEFPLGQISEHYSWVVREKSAC